MAAPISDRAEFVRKAIHLTATLVPVGWAYGWWTTPQVQLLALTLLAGAVAVEALRRFDTRAAARFLAVCGPLLRAHERDALTGATLGALAMTAVVFLLPPPPAQVALWAGIAGDGSAAVVGRLWQRMRSRERTGKSMAGSVAVATVTALGALWLVGAAPLSALGIGVAAAVAERPAWKGPLGDDNLRVATVAGAAAWALGVR